jgi:hypothetical protein
LLSRLPEGERQTVSWESLRRLRRFAETSHAAIRPKRQAAWMRLVSE